MTETSPIVYYVMRALDTRDEMIARSVIRATLEYLSAYASDGMADAGVSQMVEFPMRREHAIEPFRAMLSTALKEMEGSDG